MISTYKKTLLQFIITACVLWGTNVAHAKTLEYSDLRQPIQLNQYIDTLEDAERSLSYQELVKSLNERPWQNTEGYVFIGSNKESRYWFNFAVSHTGEDQPQNTILYMPTLACLIFQIKFWIVYPDGTTEEFNTGYNQALEGRAIQTRQIAIPIKANSGKVQIIGWIDNNILNRPATLPFTLASEAQFYKADQRVQSILVAFYSIMFALLLYNLFLYINLRHRMYGIYLAFLLMTIYECGYTDGTTGLYLWVNAPFENIRFATLSTTLVPLLYLLFVRSALTKLKLGPVSNRLYQVAVVLGVLVLCHNAFLDELARSAKLSKLYTVLTLPVALLVLIAAIRQKLPTAGYLLLAEAFAIVGGFCIISIVEGKIPSNEYLIWSLHAGLLGEALLLSLALAARTRHIQDESIALLHNYQKIYEQSLDGFFEYDLNRKRLHCNNAFASLLGYQSNRELPLGNPMNFFNDDVKKELPSLLAELGQVIEYETVINNPALSKSIWVSLTLKMIYDNQKPIKVEGTVRDISERKLKEEAERQQNLAEQLTIKAEQEQATIKAASEAKSQFFASISHEFRTPLTAILGYAETGMEKDVSTEQKNKNLHIISQSGAYLLQLVNDILDLSKIEARRLDVESIDIDVPTLIEEVSQNFAILSQAKSILFDTEIIYPLPKTIASDPTRIKQVLINICGNAVKFTEKGGVKVTVSCDPNSETIAFAVKDTGIGLKPDQIETVFEAFKQAETSTTREYGGTGLGLYLSKMIIEKLGGELTVSSQYGEGSVFTITVGTGSLANTTWIEETEIEALSNVTPTEMTKSITNGSSAAADSSEGESSRALRVLLAEDNPVNQQLLSYLIKSHGAELTLVADGAEAVQQGLNQSYDIIFVDMMMPVMGGLDAVKILRAKEVNCKIVALTSNVGEDDITECLNAGCDAHLEKPVDKEKLTSLLRHPPSTANQ